jgi:hypothetical protein
MLKLLGGKSRIIGGILPIVFSTDLLAKSEIELLREEVASLREELTQMKQLLKETVKKETLAAKDDPDPKKKDLKIVKKAEASDKKEEKILAVPKDTKHLPTPEKLAGSSQKDETDSTGKSVEAGTKVASAPSEAPSATVSANLVPTFSWPERDITSVIVGSASAGYSKTPKDNGSFNILDYNPLFLVSYKDEFFLRASVDFSLDDEGDTSVSLDYSNINMVLNDYMVLGAGKFDSALGYFVQNLSPAWINRLPDAPVGFDGDQAAPQAEVGMRMQGGFPICDTMKGNYILYVVNGDRGFVDTTKMVIDHIGSDGYTKNFGNYVSGGRVGFLPISEIEVGVSAAGGRIALIDLDDSSLLQRSRNYYAIGGDITYRPENWVFRGEYIQQQINSRCGRIVPQKQVWKAGYLQASYKIPKTQWEPVVRYGKFLAPVSRQKQQQWAFGLDYWFAPSIVIQAAYEINSGHHGTPADDNLFIIQFAYGF